MGIEDFHEETSSSESKGLGFVIFLCVGYMFVAVHAAYQFRQTTLVQSTERTPSATAIRYVSKSFSKSAIFEFSQLFQYTYTHTHFTHFNTHIHFIHFNTQSWTIQSLFITSRWDILSSCSQVSLHRIGVHGVGEERGRFSFEMGDSERRAGFTFSVHLWKDTSCDTTIVYNE